MARRKKNMTYEEELTYLDSEISKTEETLKALKTRKKELAKVKEQEVIEYEENRDRRNQYDRYK